MFPTSKKQNTHRVFPGESNRCRPDGAKARRAEAIARQDIYNSLTPQQHLKRLDEKFGVGLGAKKERAKLLKRIESGETVVKITNKIPNVGTEDLSGAQLSAELLAEIEALNEESGPSKKKIRAKDRRAREQKSN